MNKEVIKAMNRKPNKKKESFRKWWSKNGYKVMRIILFPVWLFCLAYEKINKWLNNRNCWNESRAMEIFDYYIPRRAEWDAEKKEFYFFDNGMGWGKLATKHLKLKDRRFWWNHNSWCGGALRTFLIHNFQLKGFTKEVGNCSDGRTEITFKMIENN